MSKNDNGDTDRAYELVNHLHSLIPRNGSALLYLDRLLGDEGVDRQRGEYHGIACERGPTKETIQENGPQYDIQWPCIHMVYVSGGHGSLGMAYGMRTKACMQHQRAH